MSSATDTTPILVKDRVRLAGFLKRKQGLSKEDFRRRWLEHGKLFRSLEISKVITRYEQLHINDEGSELLAGMGVLTSEWDGIAIMEGSSFAEILGILLSEEYRRVLVPDEETFLDRSPPMQVMPLNFSVIISRDDN